MAGPTMVHFMSWISERRRLQEPLVIQENVKQFPKDLLVRLLGDIYELQVCILDPSNYGWPVVRTRQYCVLRHRVKTAAFRMPFKEFVRYFRRDSTIDYSSFFVAPLEEQMDEIAWAANRPTSLADGNNVEGKPLVFDPQSKQETAWDAALTRTESQYLQGYRKRFGTLKAFGLGQNPERHPHHSPDLQKLPCAIANAHILYSDRDHRWYTPRELSLTQMFPTYACFSDGCECTSFQRDRCRGEGPRRRVSTIAQAGKMCIHSHPRSKHLWETPA